MKQKIIVFSMPTMIIISGCADKIMSESEKTDSDYI